MPLLHAEEVAEKVGNRLPYGRGSESACRVYSHLLSRDRQGAVVLVLFQQPLKRAPHSSRPTTNTGDPTAWRTPLIVFPKIRSLIPVCPCAPITTRSGFNSRATRTISSLGLRPGTTVNSTFRPWRSRESAMSRRYRSPDCSSAVDASVP